MASMLFRCLHHAAQVREAYQAALSEAVEPRTATARASTHGWSINVP